MSKVMAPAEPRTLSDCVVVVTPRSFGVDDPGLRRDLESRVGEVRYCPGPLPATALAEVIVDADGLLAGLDELNGGVLARAQRLRVIARYGVGVDRVDLRAAAERHIVVTNTPGANANAVAELTVALVFALARDLVKGRDRARAGHWTAPPGLELVGRTLGLIGLGRVGNLVAQKARALGMKTIAYDPYAAGSSGLDDVLAGAHFLSLHVPLSDATRGMVDQALLAKLRPGAFLVNTARGELVDEEALVWALDEGPLRAAALDVLLDEPPSPAHRLLSRDDVLVTPHMAARTTQATKAMGRAALDDLLAVLEGRPPAHAV